ncbi:Exosome complex component RRP45 [Wickerhamiella sorbophila]|uniref:Exosome complex component RRP45 n=1 Tax=Wickerhamiella sorbophila TaxID=45607 RepID=A0A2T0FH50_9ASCO|nr:Exosome complex component RRP45 [Wickerhamiella sorbophila]PRT54287.1 Exosome complex component RRP45 [Wickerhamiella sorbophila]
MSSIEQAFVQSLLEDQKRVSGRRLNEARKLELAFGGSYGHVEVKMGRTRLVAQVSSQVAKPRDDRPFEGLFLITTDVSSMASPRFENGRQTVDELMVTRLIEKAIRRSNALDLESLCIVAGQSCWMVRADVHYLEYDGGFIDASCIAVIAALLHFRRPDTSIDGSRTIVHTLDERPPVPLSVLHVPICVSWSFFDNDIIVVDADEAEQDLRIGSMTITINKDRDICQFTKAGKIPLSSQQIIECCEQAHGRAREITDLIHEKLKQDFEKRNRGNMGFDLAENDR